MTAKLLQFVLKQHISDERSNVTDTGYKIRLFMELTRQLGIETLAESQEVPEWQKQTVRQRIQKSEENLEQLLVWDDVKDSLKLG